MAKSQRLSSRPIPGQKLQHLEGVSVSRRSRIRIRWKGFEAKAEGWGIVALLLILAVLAVNGVVAYLSVMPGA